MNSQQISQIVANIESIIRSQSNQSFDYNRLEFEFNKAEYILKFWKNPNQCKKCNAYHPRNFPRCNTKCDKCNERGHVGNVCYNKAYINNLLFACQCNPRSVKKLKTNLNNQGLLTMEERKYSMHCCNCNRPVCHRNSRPYDTRIICLTCDNLYNPTLKKRRSSQELNSKVTKISRRSTPEPTQEPEDPMEEIDYGNNQSKETEIVKGSEMFDQETLNYKLITGKIANQIFSGRMHHDILLHIHYWLAQSYDFEGLTNLIRVNKHNYNVIQQQTIKYNVTKRIQQQWFKHEIHTIPAANCSLFCKTCRNFSGSKNWTNKHYRAAGYDGHYYDNYIACMYGETSEANIIELPNLLKNFMVEYKIRTYADIINIQEKIKSGKFNLSNNQFNQSKKAKVTCVCWLKNQNYCQKHNHEIILDMNKKCMYCEIKEGKRIESTPSMNSVVNLTNNINRQTSNQHDRIVELQSFIARLQLQITQMNEYYQPIQQRCEQNQIDVINLTEQLIALGEEKNLLQEQNYHLKEQVKKNYETKEATRKEIEDLHQQIENQNNQSKQRHHQTINDIEQIVTELNNEYDTISQSLCNEYMNLQNENNNLKLYLEFINDQTITNSIEETKTGDKTDDNQSNELLDLFDFQMYENETI